MTHALLQGSPAIDAAVGCNVTEDQRHVARPQGAACDVGAYEFDGYVTIGLAVDNSVTVNPQTGIAVMTGSLKCSEPSSVELEFGLAQNAKGRVPAVTQGSASTTLACNAAMQYWSVSLAPATGTFTNGSALASVETVNPPAWVTPASVSKSVKLFWGKK